MPTGYTAMIFEGATAKQFAARCMRAFGVAAHMRDDDWDKEVPRQLLEDESTWHKEGLEKAKAELEAWHLMPMMDKIIWAQTTIDDRIARYEAEIAENEMNNLKLKKTFVLISHMAVPEELNNFKSFMLEQLSTSMEDSSYYREEIQKFKEKTPESFIADHSEQLGWVVKNHQKRLEEGRECLVKNNRILALMWAAIDSIPE
jgi:hypothetical protein